MSSDHRVAGSSPAGCISSPIADRRAIQSFKTTPILTMHQRFILTFRVQVSVLVKVASSFSSSLFLPGAASRRHSDAPGLDSGAFGDVSGMMGHYPETGDRLAAETATRLSPIGDTPDRFRRKAKNASHLRPGIGPQCEMHGFLLTPKRARHPFRISLRDL
jgi:hypothetical protein